MNISGPTDVKVIESSTRNLAKMLPPHIFVPMTSREHDDLYEDRNKSGACIMSCPSESGFEIRTLEEGMTECKEDMPTPYIDESEL